MIFLRQSGTIREIVLCWKKLVYSKLFEFVLCDFTDNGNIRHKALIDGVNLKPLAIRKYNEWILGPPGTKGSLNWSYGCPEGHVKEKSQSGT